LRESTQSYFIAVGLEQTVEAIHHRHERSELRETLHHESKQIFKDSRSTAATLAYHQDWTRASQRSGKGRRLAASTARRPVVLDADPASSAACGVAEGMTESGEAMHGRIARI
jgi:hypothetical protein